MKQLQFLNAVGLAGIVSVLVSTPASAQIVEVTGVRLNPTPGGVEVILETENEKPLQAFSGSYVELSLQMLLPQSGVYQKANRFVPTTPPQELQR